MERLKSIGRIDLMEIVTKYMSLLNLSLEVAVKETACAALQPYTPNLVARKRTDHEYIQEAMEIATKSPDEDTQVRQTTI